MYESLITPPAVVPATTSGGNPSIDAALAAEGVTGREAEFIKSIYQQESGSGSNTKTSNAGAVGGMQIIPSTFRSVADQGWDIQNPEHNLRAGIRYARQGYKESGGDPVLAGAFYYGGPGGMAKARDGAAVSDPRNPNAPNTLQYGAQVAKRMGAAPAAAAETAPSDAPYFTPASGGYASLITPPPLARTTLEAAKDVALGAGAGVVQGVEMVASAFGADNAVARGANDVAQKMVDMQSPARKQQREQRAAAIQEAETSGSTWAEIVANVGAFADAPVESTLNAVGTSVPTLLTALIPGLGQANVARLVVQGAVGAAQGAGSVKGSIYEAVERELSKPGPNALSKDDAKKAAAAAQAYDSQNGGDIAFGALIGWAAGTTGIEKSLARILSKEGGEAAAAGVAKRAAMGVLAEAPTEGLQGGQERLAANRALQNEGFNTPTWQGVAGNAAGEAAASVVPGGVFGAMTPSRPELPPELKPVAEKAAEPNSPLSKAAMAGNTPEVVAQREAERQAAQPPAPSASANTAARLAELEAIGEGRPAQAAKDGQGRDVEIPAEPGRFFTAEEKAEYDDLTARRDATPGAKPKEADTIGDRAKEIATAVRESGALETLRSPDSPVKASDLVKDLATAQSPNTPAAAREQALGRVEFALQWAGVDLAARPKPATATPAPQADPVIAAMGDPKVSAEDKAALRDAYNNALNVRLPQATRDQALAQAREIAGRYAAAPVATPAAEQTPAVLSPIDGAPGTLLAQAERMEQGAFELAAEDFPDEAQQLRDEADRLREQAATARAGETGQELEGDTAAAAVSPEAQQPVELPTVKSTPAGDGPAYQRRRRASLQQLAANGFTTVRRDGEQFAMANPKTGQAFNLDGAADAQLARKAIADNISAAAAQTNTDPTDGQKSAGNYKKARVDFEGITIAIENPVGSERKGKSDNGKAWATPMNLAHYGYLPSTSAADGDGVDVYVMNTPRIGAQAYVIDQYNEDGSFDETKTVLGASSEAEALRVYDAGFSDGSGPDRRGAVTAMPINDFKAWASSPAAKKPAGPAPEPAPGAVVDGSMKVKLSKDESVDVDLVKELPEVESVARGGRATRISKKQGAVIEAIAQAFGKRVQFYTGENSTRVGDGFILPSDPSTVYLNATSSRSPIVVFGHEVLHQLKRDNPEAHAAIVAVVARRMNREAVQDIYGKLGYEDGQIMEELVSDLGGDLMADPSFWADVMAEVREANGDSAAKKILAKLAEFLYRAIDAMSKNLRSYADTGAGSALVDDMAEIRAAFRDALAGYMQTHGIAKPSMQAEILRAGQEAKRSAARNQTPEDQRKALTEKLRGTDGWLKAPNGKKTNLDERQWVVVRTPAFKAWFGDWESDPANASKAVDENGEPKVFYHGSTEAGFTEFDADGKGKTKGTGAFFTDDFRMAVGYSGTRDDAPVYPAERVFADPDLIDGLSMETGILVEVTTSPRGDKSLEWYESEEAALEDLELDPGEELVQKPGYRMTDPDGYETVGTKEEIIDAISDIKVRAPGVYDAFLNVRDLVEIDWQGRNWDEGPTEQIWNILDEDGDIYDTAYSQKDADATLAKNPGFSVEQTSQAQYDSTDDAARSGRDMGADGVLIKDVFDTGPKGYAEDGNVLVVYDPKNIKSASANTGAFDSADANITRSSARTDKAQGAINSGVTDTPEFKRWFGRSKIVDAVGAPLIVYHGAGNGGAQEFSRQNWKTAYGHFFTDDKEAADYYTHGPNPQTYAVHLKAEKPLRLDRIVEDGHGIPSALKEWIEDNFDAQYGDAAEQFNDWLGNADLYSKDNGRTQDDLMRWAEDAGYDAVVFYDAKGGGGVAKSFVVFDGNQIKSATGNNGEFGESANIYRSASRDAKAAAERQGYDTSKTYYHGTTAKTNFKAFKSGKNGVNELGAGIYVTDSPLYAQAWARGDGGRVMPLWLKKGDLFDLGARRTEQVYLDLARRLKQENPVADYEVQAKEISERSVTTWTDEERRIFNRASIDPWRSWLLESDRDLADNIKRGSLNAWLERAGYVGAFNEHSQIQGQVVVFKPESLKSSIGNRGAFDPADPSIIRSADRDAEPAPRTGVHYSKQPRNMLDGRKYGTGMRGIESGRLDRSSDPRIKDRVYAYINGTPPEDNVGRFAHEIDLGDNLYDATTDPLKLWVSRDLNKVESSVLDAGFDGYYTGDMAVILGDASHSVKASPINGAAAETLKKSLLSREIRELDVQAIPGARMRAGSLEIPVGSIATANAELSRIGSGARFSKTRDDPMEVSSRAPWAKTSTEDPITDLLVVGLDSSRAGEKAFEKNIALVRDYPNYRPAKSASTTERQAERFIEATKDNLLWLYDQVPAEIRDRSHLWYDGANKIANTWGPKYNLQPSQIAGVMAVLSPQKDWFMNVDLARRVIDTMDGHGDTRWNAEMTATAQRIFGKPQYADDVKAITGKTLDEVESLALKAMWVRTYDETYNDRAHALLSPEGDVMGKVMTQKDAPAKVAWGDLGSIGKAVAIIQDGTLANISTRLGGEHKVRNFYNNILVPNGANGHVTIDTHAVAAALLRPLSGSSLEVLHNFGGAGAASSAIHGSSGTYGLYAEAYRRAAAERGILAREMQSITWEAVRGLFTPGFKSQQKNVDTTDGIWENYRKGRLSLENARQQILDAAGGIEEPSWFRSGAGSPTQEGRGDAGVIPGVRVPRGGAQSAAGGAGGPAAEATAVQRSAARDGGGQQLAADQALPGSPRVEGATGPDHRLVAVAEAYAQKIGIDLRRQAEYVQVDEKRAARIAAAYEAMEHAPQDRKVKAAYANLIKQTRAQYNALVEAGYSFYFADQTNDPYGGNPWNAMRDLRANQQMAVFPTAAGFGSNETFDPADNPLLADTGLVWGYGSPDGRGMRVLANDLFRAVHDAFGHGLEGAGFRAQGEENAWQAHIRMFTGAAKGAITSETRGQNSWLNYNAVSGEANRTAKVEDTVFADQKTGLMPEWTWNEGLAGDMPARRSAARDITNTPEFKAWFGDSKVVDAEGKPLIVYHGSATGFTEFKKKNIGVRDPGFFGAGFYFAPDEESAQGYADSASEADGGSAAGEVIPAYVSLKNPFVWDMEPGDGAKSTRNALARFGVERSSVRGDSAALSNPDERKRFNAAVRAAGHDGVIVRDEDGFREVVAFEPTQIKSAIGNNGNFDPNDANITRSATRDLPKATLADFEPRGISRLLGVDNWAILTAENPMGEQAGEKTNAAAMRRLRQRLAEMDGVEFRAIRGKYGDNEENSLAVVGITEEQAKELGREFNQDSVLTRKGLIYQDGSINPATGIEVFRSAPDNYYSKIGDTIFRIDIDFDTTISPEVARAKRPVSYAPSAGLSDGDLATTIEPRAERNAELVELRKRLSVLDSIARCMTS